MDFAAPAAGGSVITELRRAAAFLLAVASVAVLVAALHVILTQ